MRISSFALGAALLGMVVALVSPPAQASLRTSQGTALLADIVAGRDHAVAARFDPRMRASLGVAGLRAAWTKCRDLLGDYVSHGEPHETLLGRFTVVQIPLELTRQPGEFRVTFDGDGLIAGLYFLKPNVPL